MKRLFITVLILVLNLSVFLPNLSHIKAHCEYMYYVPELGPDVVFEPMVSARCVLSKSVFREGDMLVLALSECETSTKSAAPWGWYSLYADVDADYGGTPDRTMDYFDATKEIWDFAASTGEFSDEGRYQMALLKASADIRGFVCLPSDDNCHMRLQDHDGYNIQSLSSTSMPL